MAKTPQEKLASIAKKYGGKTDKSGYMPGSYNFKNYGLDDLAQAIWSKSMGGNTRVGVYLNKKQAARYAGAVAYAKKLGIEVGIAKVGPKNRPYDILVGKSSGSKSTASSTAAATSTTSTATSEDPYAISRKIADKLSRKRTKFGE